MPITKLPAEILLNVFDFVNEIKDLRQCRWVCRDWYKNAKMVLFSKPIRIDNEQKALEFFKDLTRDEETANLVRFLNITGRKAYDKAYAKDIEEVTGDSEEDTEDEDPENEDLENENPERIDWYEDIEETREHPSSEEYLCVKILQLVFTSKLLVIDGDMNDDYSYQIMSSIAEKNQSKMKFKLKWIPNPSVQESDAYKEAVLWFTGSLEHLYILISRLEPPAETILFEKLKDFKRLKSLKLTIERNSLYVLKLIVDSCCQLQVLDIDWIEDSNRSTTQQIQEWFDEHDTQNTRSLKFLKISNCFSCIPLNYLVLKYAKIESVLMDMRSYIDHADARREIELGTFENLHLRVVEALKKVSVYSLKFRFNESNPLENVLAAAQTVDSNTTIKIFPPDMAHIEVRLHDH
ncbi:hypothetical protein BD408DRAFT_433192 [Parasitella parasitica]|nr:hypothetical protein BD408DRAFT_433192 [Parasitella parasitica]